MKEEKEYIKDLSDIREMMERSSRFLSLSGLAGVLSGIYAIAGAFIAYSVFGFNPDSIDYIPSGADNHDTDVVNVILVAISILVLALATVVFLSGRNASKRGEKLWNNSSRRLLANMSVPLATGGILIIIFIFKNLVGLVAPVSLIFYGLALFGAGRLTLSEVRYLGITQIILGVAGFIFIPYSLVIWVLGFGFVNIVYGIYMHYKYEK